MTLPFKQGGIVWMMVYDAMQQFITLSDQVDDDDFSAMMLYKLVG